MQNEMNQVEQNNMNKMVEIGALIYSYNGEKCIGLGMFMQTIGDAIELVRNGYSKPELLKFWSVQPSNAPVIVL